MDESGQRNASIPSQLSADLPKTFRKSNAGELEADGARRQNRQNSRVANQSATAGETSTISLPQLKNIAFSYREEDAGLSTGKPLLSLSDMPAQLESVIAKVERYVKERSAKLPGEANQSRLNENLAILKSKRENEGGLMVSDSQSS